MVVPSCHAHLHSEQQVVSAARVGIAHRARGWSHSSCFPRGTAAVPRHLAGRSCPARKASTGPEEAARRSVRAWGAVDTEGANLALTLAARAGSALGGSQGAIVAGLAGGAFAADIELRVLFALVADIEMVISA